MIVISPNVVLSSGEGENGNNPVIGYDNLVSVSAVAATTAAPNYPATNLANPATNLRWIADPDSPPADEYLTVTITRLDPVDYVAIARHNFGTEQIPVSVEINTGDSPEWQEVIAPALLPDDGPVLFRFEPQTVLGVRVRLQPAGAAPFAAVLYVGKLLILQRRLYVGHTPLPLGRNAQIVTGQSESGQYLGRTILQEGRNTAVSLQNLTAAWYRAYLDPFIEASKLDPFFFAWRPQSYPYETGFAWMTNEPRPVNARSNGMMSIDLQMSGIA